MSLQLQCLFEIVSVRRLLIRVYMIELKIVHSLIRAVDMVTVGIIKMMNGHVFASFGGLENYVMNVS
jgi:hypothetical protein